MCLLPPSWVCPPGSAPEQPREPGSLLIGQQPGRGKMLSWPDFRGSEFQYKGLDKGGAHTRTQGVLASLQDVPHGAVLLNRSLPLLTVGRGEANSMSLAMLLCQDVQLGWANAWGPEVARHGQRVMWCWVFTTGPHASIPFNYPQPLTIIFVKFWLLSPKRRCSGTV